MNINQHIIDWLTFEKPSTELPICDFERTCYELRPGDVLLIEGRSRISEVIKLITQSPWSHACLHIGRLHDIEDPTLREKLTAAYPGDLPAQIIIEGYLGKGTIISSLENYKTDNIRICRPRGLSRTDAQKVIAHAIDRLGSHYDVRQVFDLARFLFPWSIMPRKWRSSLFQHHIGLSTKTVCSTMIAEAFASIDFPILPVIKHHEESGVELFARNPRLLTPRDFDYSPYFEIIKHPFVPFAESPYRQLPWNREGFISHDGKNIIHPEEEQKKRARTKKKHAQFVLKFLGKTLPKDDTTGING